MAKNDKVIGNELLQDKFVQMYCTGLKIVDIAIEFGVDRSTPYLWLKRDDIKDKIEKYKQEIETTGKNFIKGRYVEYLKNIDKLARQDDDKRTALSANQWLVEKMDGKATTMIDLTTKDGNNINVTLEDYPYDEDNNEEE
ncbi:helix-turn-helix domain-containing protein [Clostridium pasteurianum]|uniref:Homeodomain phBC6A51-type domain-containing protein n=1 Tax=Clostridium pasteurianum BC1 TaxID=86416 RepID=R4KAX6_CLOPA|nr:helix-turn-helix domain-containing protein [Clostridium pasteurianum]AGK96790.1 hypothetical protein Clopa_1890 [Clostridium pasteurianum BC1]